MSRLIDADALIRRWCGIKCGCERDECGREIEPCIVVMAIEEAMTIDAVEVVRCKDCKWYGTYQLTKYGEYDKRYKPTVCIKGEYSIMRNEDWFCADGERKEL